MGSDLAPFMANLFVYCYEDKWIRKTKRKDLIIGQKLGAVSRFIDEIYPLHEIYLPELELKEESSSPFEVSFLGLNIKIADKKVTLDLYDESRSFPFSIV